MSTDILLISKNEAISQLIQMELSVDGYHVLVESDSITGLMTTRNTKPHLLILDTAISGLSALDICHRLKTTNAQVKILLLTEHKESYKFEKLVDDYLFKPLSLNELLLRVKLHLNQSDQDGAHVLRFEDLSMNLQTYEVYRGQRLIELTHKEFELLSCLLHHPNQVLEHDQLLDKVWGFDFMGNHNILQVYIRYLRKKLELNGESRIIHTLRSVGYILKASNSSKKNTSIPVICFKA